SRFDFSKDDALTYMERSELLKMGFKRLGENVLISTKASIYNPEMMEIGSDVRIDDFCVVSGQVVFGNYNYVGPLGLIAGGDTGVLFEDFVTLSYRVQVFSQ